MNHQLVEGLIFVLGVTFSAGALALYVKLTRRDVNGLGRKYARMLAFSLRCIAEDVTETDAKSKLMHLADLIEPK